MGGSRDIWTLSNTHQIGQRKMICQMKGVHQHIFLFKVGNDVLRRSLSSMGLCMTLCEANIKARELRETPLNSYRGCRHSYLSMMVVISRDWSCRAYVGFASLSLALVY